MKKIHDKETNIGGYDINYNPEVPDKLQETSDYINHLLDNELWFIKQAFFQMRGKLVLHILVVRLVNFHV